MTLAARPRAAFFGTPEFAATVLESLLAPNSPVDVVLAVTQPDRPAGRSQAMQAPPVKLLAAARGVPVRQPLSVRRPSTIASIGAFGAEVGIVVAYGRILPVDLLGAFPHGCVNVHASVLPRWRGAWPVGAAIRAGDAETGVTIMRLDAGMDTGPVIATRTRPIGEADTTASLSPLLSADGAALLREALPGYLQGTTAPVAQDDTAATWCRPVTKEDGRIDWAMPSGDVCRHVRAMHDWPGAWTTWAGRRIVVRAAVPAGARATGGPGTVRVTREDVLVATGSGAVALHVIQMEGRGATDAGAFARGQRSLDGATLGN